MEQIFPKSLACFKLLHIKNMKVGQFVRQNYLLFKDFEMCR